MNISLHIYIDVCIYFINYTYNKLDLNIQVTCASSTYLTNLLMRNYLAQLAYIKQIFHAFLFNIRNYSPEVINIQRHEAELNIILARVNNFNIKQKRHGIFVLLYAINTKQDLGR